MWSGKAQNLSWVLPVVYLDTRDEKINIKKSKLEDIISAVDENILDNDLILQ